MAGYPEDRAIDRHLSRLGPIAIVLLAVAVRLGLMAGGMARLDDPDNYLPLARSIARGDGFAINGRPTAFRPPLYPLMLTPVVAALPDRALPWGVGALHLLMGGGTVAMVGWAARRLGLSDGRAIVASLIVALDPVLAVQSRSIMTETPAAFLVSAALLMLTWPGIKGAVLGGIGFGLAGLCRPSLLPWAALVAISSLAFGPGSRNARILRAILIVAATMATLAPWAWRNARAVGEPIWTTTHGGYTMALANNPAYYADVLNGPPGAVWSGANQRAWFDEVDRSMKGRPEPEADRAMGASAVQLASERPRDFVRASIARLGRFWGLAPSGAVYPGWLRILTAVWTLPLWVATVVGSLDRRWWRWPGVAAPALLMALTAVHSVYWTDLRMRGPIVPAVALIACAGSFVNPRRPADATARAASGEKAGKKPGK